MRDKLKARLAELEGAEANAIHTLGVVSGRLQEVKDLLAELDAEENQGRPTVERGGKKVETGLQAVPTEKR